MKAFFESKCVGQNPSEHEGCNPMTRWRIFLKSVSFVPHLCLLLCSYFSANARPDALESCDLSGQEEPPPLSPTQQRRSGRKVFFCFMRAFDICLGRILDANPPRPTADDGSGAAQPQQRDLQNFYVVGMMHTFHVFCFLFFVGKKRLLQLLHSLCRGTFVTCRNCTWRPHREPPHERRHPRDHRCRHRRRLQEDV